MKRFYWLLVFWILTLVYARVADAQKAFPGIDSAEKVISKTATAITSGTTITVGSPYKIAVTLGTGAKFAKVTPKPFIVMIESPSFTDQTPTEEFRVSAVSHDTLTLIARSPAVGHNLTPQTWAVGSRISVALVGEYIKSLQDTLNWLITSGPGSGTMTSILFQSPLTGGTITGSGTVTLPMATSSQNGYLSSGAFTAFNAKQAAISVTSPVLLAGANISILQSDATHAGYISSADWNTFNNKASYPDSTGKTGNVLSVLAGGGYNWTSAGSGTVTSVNVSGGSSGLSFINGPITNTGTITIGGGALTIGYGGTGAVTAQKALLNLIGDTTGKTKYFLGVLRGGGIGLDTVTGSGGGGSSNDTVTLSAPSFLAVGGSPATATTKALTLTLSGTALPYSSGGTGQNAWTKGDVLYASATNTLSKLGIGSTGQILTVASGLPSWAANSAGTVTSVAASGPSGVMTWSSAVTTSGTLTATLSSQSANMMLASPDGSSGTPSFRSLVVADIPALDVAQITTGMFSVARGGTGRATLTANDLVIGNGTSAVTLIGAGGSNTVLSGSTTPSYVTLATDVTLLGNGIGTSFGIDLTHANTWTGTPTVNKVDIRTTYTDGLALTNATASDVTHTVQQSPSLSLLAHVWNTTSTATDSVETWRITNVPVSGTSTTSFLMLDNGNTAGGFTNVGSLSDAGAFNVKTGGSYQINGTSVLNATTLGSAVVSSSLTSVGTIATGVWNGTTVAVNHGGTGATTLTGILFGNGTSAITGSHAVALTSEVTGILPVANGGTASAYSGAWFSFGNSDLPTTSPTTGATDAIAIGDGANAVTNGVALGLNAMTTNTDAVAIGTSANAGNGGAGTGRNIAIGYRSRSGGGTVNGTVAIGISDTATGANAVAIGGAGTNATATGSFIGGGSNNRTEGGNSFSAIVGGNADTVLNAASGPRKGFSSAAAIIAGTHNAATGFNQVVLGNANVPIVSGSATSQSQTDALLIVGASASNGLYAINDTASRKNTGFFDAGGGLWLGGAPAVCATCTAWGSGGGTYTGTLALGFTNTTNYAKIQSASQAATTIYTIRDAGAAADFLTQTSNLAATGSIITSTATRGVLSSVAIGSTGQVLAVSGGVPTWTNALTATAKGTGSLASGTVTINTPYALTGSVIMVTDASGGVVGNIGSLRVANIVNGASFDVISSNPLDSSNFYWIIF